MRKILFLFICFALVLGSCNKSKKLNKALDGSWISTVQDGQAVSSDDAIVITFSKNGKDDGAATIIVYNNNSQFSRATGTYKIADRGKTLTIDATGTTAANGSTPSSSFAYHATGKVSSQTDTKFTYNVATSTTPASGGIGVPINDNMIIEFTKQ